MKKFLALTALSLISSSAFAGFKLDCIGAISGRDAGQILIESNRIEFFQTNGSNEGWQLLIENNGTVYSNDMMVQHGKQFEVGKIVAVTGGYKLLQFAGRGDLLCR